MLKYVICNIETHLRVDAYNYLSSLFIEEYSISLLLAEAFLRSENAAFCR